MITREEALWAAKLHVRTSVRGTPGTIIDTETLLAICRALVDLDAQNKRTRAEVSPLFTDGITVTP